MIFKDMKVKHAKTILSHFSKISKKFMVHIL